MPNLNTMDTTYGALFIGLILSAVAHRLLWQPLWDYIAADIHVLQTVSKRFMVNEINCKPQFLPFFKVFLLWALDTAHLILCTVGLYHYLISNFNNPDALHKTTWDNRSMVMSSANVTTATSLISHSAFLLIEFGQFILAFIHFGRQIIPWSGSSVHSRVVRRIALEKHVFHLMYLQLYVRGHHWSFGQDLTPIPMCQWVTGTGLGCAAAADIMIAASLCYYLSKSRTGSSRIIAFICVILVRSKLPGFLLAFRTRSNCIL
ncbi:hypothetical protein M413DRAFT_7539 [Hebeloma cylindrosporum]|uniref:Uncharacterized protein n=1 Tax=Hebeloma cylindrosporum TaxID=76867 RepID=A0A0C3CSE4_HEBCY|nr:hypothetical protein M413DRAFT_7539 [Hebeloma cylindrosporum h7]